LNEKWRLLSSRIDALSLRERVFLLLSILLVCAALVDTLWVSPVRTEHQKARLAFDANTAELRKLRDDLRLKSLQPSPVQAAQDELARVEKRVDGTNASIAAVSAALKDATSLQEVLALFLRRYPALTLVRTGSLTAEAPGGGRSPAIPRQGLELTVAGPYADLVRLLQSLEAAMPDLRWGPFKLQAEQQPPELTLQVFLVGGPR
jgi:MSHA biogenesis protein MshJ